MPTARRAVSAGSVRGRFVPLLSEIDGRLTVTEQEIEAKVIEIVAEQMGADKAKISRTTSFVDDLNADSLDTVELVMEFEDEFETSIPDDKAEQIKTVGEAIKFIMEAKKSAAA
jgi:acyl carrier protein